MLQHSAEYAAAREALRQAEIALKDQGEAVAALRRTLPPGPVLPDYALVESTADPDGGVESERTVGLADLFRPGCANLAVIHFMYGDGPDATPCPMCTMWADGYAAVADHIEQHMPLVMVAKAPVAKLRAHALSRGWPAMRLLSCGGTSLNRDFGMETEDGGQLPGISILTKDADGNVRQFYTACAMMGDGHVRGLDLLSPVWNMLDLTPNGRPDWFPALRYD